MKYLIIFFVACFSGCTTKKNHQISSKNQQHYQLHQDVACLTLIPDVPLGFVPEKIVHDADAMQNAQIVYRAIKKHESMDLEKLFTMYCADMEMLGWEFSGVFKQEHEFLLIFVRPDSVWCQVLIQKSGTITVTVIQKK